MQGRDGLEWPPLPGSILTGWTLSVKALRLCQIPPFVTYGDIFPRCGGSLPSQGELLSISYGQR